MALNKFMHPRNIYKNPPDFALLAKTFEEFSNIAKTDVTGKVSIDFKDPHALRVLTTCLLKSDFNLNVIIPEDRLVPTLPLRLNYILWIEDLLNAVEICNPIWGVDIGTGACAIYPLLAAVKNKWHMIGTETDEESFKNATENIIRNNLQNLIELRKNSTTTTIEHLFTDEKSHVYHFTMCNPPFYTSIQELWESRSPARPPPKNGFTGSPQELITEGGELQFCRQMINESKHRKDSILGQRMIDIIKEGPSGPSSIMSMMKQSHTQSKAMSLIGLITDSWSHDNQCPMPDMVVSSSSPNILRRKSLLERKPNILKIHRIFTTMVGHKYNLKELLIDLKAEGIRHTTTEFCQGRITRWGLAWTFQNYDFSNIESSRNKMRKRNVPITFTLPQTEDKDINIHNIMQKIKKMLLEIKISLKLINKRQNEIIMDVVAVANTWCNQRRKRRQKRMEESEAKVRKIDTTFSDTIKSDINKSEDKKDLKSDPQVNHTKEIDAESTNNKLPIVHAALKICIINNVISVEMEYISGSAGKEGLHQIVQFIKNNYKYIVASF